ncbi:hypothetical protein [Psittacicella hinzii]|uniref:Uncharacterized protein n=1 Tax=Psittacicella hinzii TaxID=2028575 RepID=A0A3A1YSI9_9GAMM|nr:hypothetical protein [Psittacicella hinzii]RIY40605.1 hypothetical protein CKF58_00350 [Psittacicella hinzii]
MFKRKFSAYSLSALTLKATTILSLGLCSLIGQAQEPSEDKTTLVSPPSYQHNHFIGNYNINQQAAAYFRGDNLAIQWAGVGDYQQVTRALFMIADNMNDMRLVSEKAQAFLVVNTMFHLISRIYQNRSKNNPQFLSDFNIEFDPSKAKLSDMLKNIKSACDKQQFYLEPYTVGELLGGALNYNQTQIANAFKRTYNNVCVLAWQYIGMMQDIEFQKYVDLFQRYANLFYQVYRQTAAKYPSSYGLTLETVFNPEINRKVRQLYIARDAAGWKMLSEFATYAATTRSLYQNLTRHYSIPSSE